MPELPDLVYIQKNLKAVLPGKRISDVEVKQPIVIRVLLEESFEATLSGARFKRVFRHGPFLGFTLENGIELIVHPMLAGRFRYSEIHNEKGRGLCFVLQLDGTAGLQYLDTKKMGKVYLIKQGEYDSIPRFLQQGVDILASEFTGEYFQKLISGVRKQVRVFLMDQTKLSAIGNAYADEILFHAGIHPKTFCYQLTADEIIGLYQSINTVMKWGVEQVETAQQPIEVKVRDHVKVRNRKDEPCPRCGTTIRRAGVLGYDAFFCPQCQPPRRAQFIQWS